MSEQTPPPEQNPYGAGGGTPPPPGGADHPPQAPGGGYPPPPPPPSGPYPTQPGGYGAAPPPPPGYGGTGGYDAVEAFTYGWARFRQHVGPFVLATLIVLVVSALFSFIGQTISGALFDTSTNTTVDPQTGAISVDGGGFFTGLAASAVVSFVGQVVTTLAFAGLLKMSFDVVDGQEPSLGRMLEGWDKVQVLVASLIVAVATAIGLVLCLLPGIVVAVLTAFTTAFVVDEKLGFLDAIRGSVDLVRNNVGAVLLWILLAIVTAFVGAILCFVGLLAAVPIITLSQAYTLRVLRGRQVVPVA